MVLLTPILQQIYLICVLIVVIKTNEIQYGYQHDGKVAFDIFTDHIINNTSGGKKLLFNSKL